MNSPRHERDVTPLYPERSFPSSYCGYEGLRCLAFPTDAQRQRCELACVLVSLGASRKSVSTGFRPNMGMVGFPIAIKGLAP
jgi:hypothetical protein